VSKREVVALEAILTDPQNSERSASEVAQLCIDALDAVRARTHRLAIVGQISYGPQEETRTVVLGPFSARGLLDSEEKLRRVIEGGTAAREIGQNLAWDPASKIGRGRFMLAPAFWRARDAWDFYRGDAPAQAVVEVARTLPREIVPVCLCGLKEAPACRWCGEAVTHPCPLHEPEAPTHPCREAA
jgi:hypothetical protein